MSEAETRAILTIALLAAFADGAKDERERDAVKRVSEALGGVGGADMPAIYRDVLVAKPELATLATALTSREARTLAYEMAVTVCDADGLQSPAEKEFLARLAAALSLPATEAAAFSARAEEIAGAAAAPPSSAGDLAAAAPREGTVLGRSSLTPQETDKLILNAAVTNAALELLPETLSSMAIIPLQLRLVYRIGRSYGYEMDMSHAKDFIATLGIGLTSQYVEQIGRKFLGGLLGSVAGGIGRGLGRQAASSGLTFATTYAIGRVAQRYYADGRTLDASTLKATFASMLEEAKGMAPRYRDQIEQKAGTIDRRSIAELIRNV